MDNFEENITTEQGDPKPKPRLSDQHRAQLDSIVMKMAANKESEDNIRMVVEDFKEKHIPKPKAFEINLSTPTFKSAPVNIGAREFTDQPAYDQFGMNKLQVKAQDAKAKLDAELHGNDAVYEKKLRELRRDMFDMTALKKEAKDKGYIIPIGKENEWLRLAKQKQYEMPVTPEDISDMRMGTILNSKISRNFIRDLDKPEVQKNAYLVDAYNHAAQDENGQSRVHKIKENADKIGRKILTYDPVNMILGKREGFINSIFSGRDDLNKAFDLYSYIKDKPDASVLDRLNHELTTDIDEPVPVPSGKAAEIGRMLGGQPIKGLIGGGIAAIAATAAGNPEAAAPAFNVVNAGLSGIDAYKIAYANAVKSNYAAFVQQGGLSQQEALDRAKSLAEDQANTEAAVAVAMSAAAGKMAFKPSNVTMAALKKSVGSALGQLGEAGAKKAVEGLGVGTIGGVGQIIKNIQAQNAGLPIETTAGFGDQLETGVLLTAATHIIAKSATALKPSTLNKITRAVSKMPKEVIEANINAQQEGGYLTPEEATRAQGVINDTKVMNDLIPENIPEIERQQIASKIKERNELKAKLETIDELYHPEIKEKIKALNESALNISKGVERKEIRALITKEVNSGNVEKSASDLLMNATDKELDNYIKDIATHANDPATEQNTLSAFGEKITSKAKELYPKKTASKIGMHDSEYANIFNEIENANSLKGIKAKQGAIDRIFEKYGDLKTKAEFINDNFMEIERQLISSKIIQKICP